MELNIGCRLGEGAFGDVYEATDNLGRRLAVKIIRGSAALISTALDHARALARARHPNVVTVYALEKVIDPETGRRVDGIVMERLEGDTLAKRLDIGRLSIAEVKHIGLRIIDGLGHIHAQGLAHGDLHAENVIITGSTVKVIDILYRESLALLSTRSREARLRRDLLDLRLMIHDALLRSECDPAEALTAIRDAFITVLDPTRAENLQLHVDHALERIRDENFVEGEAYAHALGQETSPQASLPILSHMLDQGGIGPKHRPYMRLLWDRLNAAQKEELAAAIAPVLDRETPRGRWGTPINMLAAFGDDGWRRPPAACRLRLEAVIVNDILAGHYNIYGTQVGSPGTLGTYVSTFWPSFNDPERLIDNIAACLATNWYRQNYIGKWLLHLLPLIADTPARREKLITGLIEAVNNDARMIVTNLARLPLDWQEDIARQRGQ